MKLLLLLLCFSFSLSSPVDQFVKHFSSKPSDAEGCNVVGTYGDYIVCNNGVIYLLNAKTGDFVSTIDISYYLIFFGADGTLDKWDLDTLIKVKQIKPPIAASNTMACKYDLDQDVMYCGLDSGILRKINMVTGKVVFEVKAHSFWCFIASNDKYVFTSGADGLVNKFDKSGSLLATFEENLGYSYVWNADQNWLLTTYYDAQGDGTRRFYGWNVETGQKVYVPFEVGPSFDLHLRIGTQYYAAFGLSGPFNLYALIHKNNFTIAHQGVLDLLSWPTALGDNVYWSHQQKFRELARRGVEFELVKILPVDYFAPLFSNFLLLPNGQALVYFDISYGNFYYSLLDLETGVFSEKLTQFDKNISFHVEDDLLIGAQDNHVVAYRLSDFKVARNVSSIVTTKILSVKVSAGIIYVQESNAIGMFNATSLEFIAEMGLTPSFGFFRATLGGIVFLDRANQVLSYDIRTGALLTTYVGPQNAVSAVLAFEDQLYVGSSDTSTVFEGHTCKVDSLYLSGIFLYSGSEDQTVRKWNVDTGENVLVYGGSFGRPFAFAVNEFSLYTLQRDQVSAWSLFTNRVLQTYNIKSFFPISLHVDGGILQSGMIDGSVAFWDMESGKIIRRPLLGNSAKPAYSFEVQDQNYYIPKYDGSLLKWNYATSDDPVVIRDIDARKTTAFGTYLDLILLFKKDEGLIKYNTSSELKTRVDIVDRVSNVVVVIDEIIYSGNNDSTITKHTHDNEVTVLAGYSSVLISGGNDAALKKWDRLSMSVILVMKRQMGNLGHLGGITSIFIINDVLFSGGVDTTAKRWDLSTGKVLYTYTGHIKKVRCVYYHNSSFFTSGEDGLIQMFTVILPKPISTTKSRTTALASRINPIIVSQNLTENATLSTLELIIIVAGAAYVLIFSLFIFVRIQNKKKQSKTPEVAGKDSTFADTRFANSGQDQTLVQTSVGLSIPASKEVSETDFILKTLLSKGGGGSVHYAKALTKNLQKYGETVIAKVLKENYSSLAESAKAMFNQEIGIMEMLHAKGCFAEMLGYSLKPCTIITKLYKHGSLFNWIRDKDFDSLKTMMSFCLDTATSIATMHTLQLAHCDLKPDNILIDEDRTGQFKCVITDFGICHVLSESIIDAKSFNHINVRGV